VQFNILKPQTVSSKYRLVIEARRFGNGVEGRVKRGNETVHGWGTSGVPTDLSRFLATHYYYESTPRYFETFLKLTNSRYPIVCVDAEGNESPLVYCDESLRGGIAFDIRGDEIHISRTLDNGSPIPAGALLHGQMLFNPEEGTIHAISNRSAWKIWEAVIDVLDGVSGAFENDDEEINDPITSQELLRLPHSVVAPISLFNAAAIRLNPELIAGTDGECCFLRDGLDSGPPRPVTPSYLLDIPLGMTTPKVLLTPVGLYEGKTFSFSAAAFWLLNPHCRSNLSIAMKTKKRVKAVLETAFALQDETKPTARTTIIRSLTNTADFLKRVVKREAKELLNQLSEGWNRNVSLLMAGSDGWLCVDDDVRSQARIIQLLFETFGIDAFGDDLPPCGVEVSTAQLLKELPRLAAQLQREGFMLRIGSEPLATASWEFVLDATRSGMDWFELKPEIRCNGEILSNEDMDGLFNGSGMLRRNGSLMLLDDTSAQVMSMFSGAMTNGKKRKGGPELVRVPRLQILDWLQLRNHGVTIKLSPEDATILESLLNFASIPDRMVPSGLNATLRHYQIDAWHWLAFCTITVSVPVSPMTWDLARHYRR